MYSLNPDQARNCEGPDLGLNYLQNADNKSKELDSMPKM